MFHAALLRLLHGGRQLLRCVLGGAAAGSQLTHQLQLLDGAS
jgi:hypothetical protein